MSRKLGSLPARPELASHAAPKVPCTYDDEGAVQGGLRKRRPVGNSAFSRDRPCYVGRKNDSQEYNSFKQS
jgi:hypothetical protein